MARDREAMPWSPTDQRVWSELWARARGFWPTSKQLAVELGFSEASVSNWSREVNPGPWPGLRIALLEGARRSPEQVPRVIEVIADQVLDSRGRWVPDVAPGAIRELDVELLELHGAIAGLHPRVMALVKADGVTAGQLEDAAGWVREAEEQLADVRACIQKKAAEVRGGLR